MAILWPIPTSTKLCWQPLISKCLAEVHEPIDALPVPANFATISHGDPFRWSFLGIFSTQRPSERRDRWCIVFAVWTTETVGILGMLQAENSLPLSGHQAHRKVIFRYFVFAELIEPHFSYATVNVYLFISCWGFALWNHDLQRIPLQNSFHQKRNTVPPVKVCCQHGSFSSVFYWILTTYTTIGAKKPIF